MTCGATPMTPACTTHYRRGPPLGAPANLSEEPATFRASSHSKPFRPHRQHPASRIAAAAVPSDKRVVRGGVDRAVRGSIW